jgi:hypothetical protein
MNIKRVLSFVLISTAVVFLTRGITNFYGIEIDAATRHIIHVVLVTIIALLCNMKRSKPDAL